MRYFAQKNSTWFRVHLYEHGENNNQVYEITSEYALKLYKGLGKAGQYNLVTVPNYKRGTRVQGKTFSVWGEVVTEAECFKRRLSGQLANDILNERIADE